MGRDPLVPPLLGARPIWALDTSIWSSSFPQLEGALDKGHEVSLEALPKDVQLSKEALDAVLYFLGALTGKHIPSWD